MPSTSKRQQLHLTKLNQLPQVVAQRFKRKHPHYLGMYDGKQHYLAPICGHEVINSAAKRCRICYSKSRRINGPTFVTQQGYRIFNVEGKQHYMHRVIAERILGRPLKRNEVVHHIDGNPTNNVNKNLLICSSGYHSELHHRMSELYMKEHFSAVS